MSAAASQPWYRAATAAQWKVLWAAMLGWGLDGMDVMLYAFALTAVQAEFHLSGADAGKPASIALLGAAFGGLLFGYIADRFGRARALIYSILFYSIFTAASATSHSLNALLVWRFLVGLGLGGEWAAGAALVSEAWPAEHRGKAIGIVQSGWAIGYIAAAMISAAVLPTHGWRVLFLIGVAPAAFALWVWREVPEPEIWKNARSRRTSTFAQDIRKMFSGALLRPTLLAIVLTSCLLFAYWGLFTWIPTFLAKPVTAGGAGMSLVKSASWIVPMQIGAFAGYIFFGFIADAIGRRPSFVIFVLGAALVVPIYALQGRSPAVLMILGPLVGFFGHGYFSVFGSMLAELFPSDIRGLAQGLCYNAGRLVSVFAPTTIGRIADLHGIGVAIACTSVLYVVGAAVMYLLPETKGKQLA